jgi:hypothetical protein
MEPSMPKETFDVLILTGRPASGKSEIIDYLKKLPDEIRSERYHLARLDVLDDFPMLWTWFEEDHILSQVLGEPRLHTDEEGYFKHTYQWDLLIERLGLEYHKRLRDDPRYHTCTTTLVEFSRGTEHGGYQQAFDHLLQDLLERAGIVYVSVSFAESLRKNRRRFNPERPDSILEHGLPDEKLERLYRDDDWHELALEQAGYLELRGARVPYATFENEDDVTTHYIEQPLRLAERLEAVLGRLWELRAQVRPGSI